MGTAQRGDPLGNFQFLVEIDGITRAAFHEASGFDSTIEVIEHREGGDNLTPRKFPGMTKHSNIVLKRRGQEVKRWNFYNAWPSKWDGPDLNAEGNDIAIETLELAHEGLELA